MEYFSDMSQIYATKLLYSLHTNNLLFFFFSSSCIQYVKERGKRARCKFYLQIAQRAERFSASAKERLSRMQSQTCLSYAEAMVFLG